MPPTNDFVPFCNENTGTNLPSQASYLANPNLPIGNQPGVASSSLNNKALRQGSTMAAVLAQIASTFTGADMLDNQNTADHAIPAALLGVMTAATKRHSPVVTSYLSGSGNHNLTYKFQIASGNATAAATYSDGTTTFTVKTTIAAGTQLDASGNATPVTASGTLTKTAGVGDATLTYYAYRAPLLLRVRAVGGGGGGGGGGTAAGSAGGDGGDTTFGTTLIVAGKGSGGGARAAGGGGGGTASLGTGPSGVAIQGGQGGSAGASNTAAAFGTGGNGGSSFYGGSGQGGVGGNGNIAAPNSGSGGGGGSGPGSSSSNGGTGGGSGGIVDAVITTLLSTYAYAVGAAGLLGTAGTGGNAGGAGAAGCIVVEEHYQ